jgi:acetyltransferase-like isoleucine patch superfamily enzyme
MPDGNNKKKHAQVSDESTSPLKRYQRVIVGSERLGLPCVMARSWLAKEFSRRIGTVAQAAFLQGLVGKMGGGGLLERHVFHHPAKLCSVKELPCHDCLLDGSGTSNRGIIIGDNVIIGRSTTIVCKDGDITIGNDVGIGANAC